MPDGSHPPSPQHTSSAPRSRLVVLAGPTAVGKGTVAACVREQHPDIWISVSVTTRRPRPGEVDGLHYHFVDDAEFDRLVAADGLLEWAVVHRAARYGTPRAPVEDASRRRTGRAARDRPAGRSSGARAHARGPDGLPRATRARPSSSAGSSAGAPRTPKNAPAGWRPLARRWPPRPSSTSPSSTPMSLRPAQPW